MDLLALLTALQTGALPIERAAAASALADSLDARAIEPLIAALTSDPAPEVREAAARALGVGSIALGIMTPRTMAALVGAVDDADWGTRQSAAEMLVTLSQDARFYKLNWNTTPTRALDLLVADLADDEAEIRLGAAWSLHTMGDARGAAAWASLLSHWDGRIRAAAALGLAEIGDARAIPALEAAIDGDDVMIAAAARAARAQFDDDETDD